eukprot:287372-Hanusia_phi.AAC.6
MKEIANPGSGAARPGAAGRSGRPAGRRPARRLRGLIQEHVPPKAFLPVIVTTDGGFRHDDQCASDSK